MKHVETDILTRAVSTCVLTNNVCVCVFFGVSLKLALFAEDTIKLWFQPKSKNEEKVC